MQMFEAVARTQNRKLIFDDESDYWINCHFEATEGLLYEVNFVWLDDVVNLSTDFFTAIYYVDTVKNAATLFMAAANDILSNNARAISLFRKSSPNPYKIKLQRLQNERWKTFYTCFESFPWSLFPSEEVRYFFVDPASPSLP
jgi:hypothetical protein